jgi:DNA-binding MarR family transcriptional regulator
MAPQRKPASKASSQEQTETGQQLESLVLEILGAFFDLRAVGQREGLVTQSGGGSWGLLKILKEGGPMTVPTVARMRSVSRQYIQKLAKELIEAGLIEMEDNPAHKRSKLMRLTTTGERRFDELTGRFRVVLEELAGEFRTEDLSSATETIVRLRQELSRSS